MTDTNHAAILRQHADTRRRGHSVNPDVLRAAADEIERLRKERDEARRALAAWQANLEEPQTIDPADLQALIDAAWNGDRLTVRMSARDLWRMATDRRGREEE